MTDQPDIISTDKTTIQVTLNIDYKRSQQLWTTAMASFLADQPDRFEDITEPVADRSSNAGTLYWCESGADLLLLEAYERGRGHRTHLLGDLAGVYHHESGLVLLSIEPS